MERNMMLTPDEYIALKRIITSERESEGASTKNPPSSKKNSRKKDPKMARALRQANIRGRKKNGKLEIG